MRDTDADSEINVDVEEYDHHSYSNVCLLQSNTNSVSDTETTNFSGFETNADSIVQFN